jgi:hypothetical protein
MTDLETRLRELRAPIPGVEEDTVRADVGRARRALTRRRMARAASGIGAVAAVGVVASLIVAGQPSSSAPDVAAPDISSSHAPAQTGAAGLKLVDYTGAQQPGFSVAKVPAGFVLQGATPYSLDVARADDHSSLDVFEGKLVVMLQSKDVAFHKTDEPVTVHGTTGYVRTTEDGGATVLEYLDGDHDVLIQAWAGLGLTDAQLVEFADGVTVTSDAQASVG